MKILDAMRRRMKAPVRDSLQSTLTGIGTSKDNLTSLSFTTRSLSRNELEAAYQGDWVVSKAVNIPANDAVREWRDWDDERLAKEEDRLSVRDAVRRMLIYGRLYGGGGIYIGVAGDQSLEEPLSPESVGLGDLRVVNPFHRHAVQSVEFGSDVTSDQYRKPSAVVFNGGNTVHASRVILYSPELTFSDTEYWGPSIITPIHDIVTYIALISREGAAAVGEANIDVIRMPNLLDVGSDPDAKARIVNRFRTAQMAKSSTNALILDNTEEWSTKPVNLTSIDSLLNIYLLMVSGAVDIPATRMLGQSPSGLSATGESDLRNYYDSVSWRQETTIGPLLRSLDDMLRRSAGATEASYTWASLWSLSEEQRAAVNKTNADTWLQDVNSGILDFEALRRARNATIIRDGVYPGFQDILDDIEGRFDE